MMRQDCTGNLSYCHTASGYKVIKECIIVLVSSSASGNHKMPIDIIGKEEKQLSFKYMNYSLLPMKYYVQSNVWMNKEIF